MPQENKDWKEAAKLMIYSAHNLYHDGTRTTGLLEELQERNLVFIQELLDKQRNEVIKLLSQDIGMLRQWLNEDRITDPNKMVTNEEIKVWFNVLTEIKKGDK